MLLSQASQAKLGFVKDVRDGTIQVKDYDWQHLEVARQIGTGLFMVRLDHLNRDQYRNLPGSLPRLLDEDYDDTPDLVFSDEEKVAMVGYDERVEPNKLKIPKSALRANNLLVSVGWENFENTSFGKHNIGSFH